MINKPIFEHTLSKSLRLRRVGIYLLLVLAPQLLFLNVSDEAQLFSHMSLALKTEFILGYFSVFAFIWVCGLAPAVLSMLTCSSFVAKEEEDGTLLLIVSKPIKRVTLLTSKFAAFVVSSLVISALSIFLSIYLWASSLGLDFVSLMRVLGVFPVLLVYSFFVSLIFGSISAAISTMFSSRVKALVPLIFVLILTFFVFIPIRGSARSMGVYQSLLLDWVDLGYDLGNLYVGLLEAAGNRLIPYVQVVVGTFTGAYEVPPTGILIDYDHGFILPSLERATYHSLFHSLAKWVLVPLGLLALGVFIFRRRDIS